MLSALGRISAELVRFWHSNQTRSWWQKCQIRAKISLNNDLTNSRKSQKNKICLKQNLLLVKGPRGGTNSLRDSCCLGVVAIWHGAMRMALAHSNIVQIIIETSALCAQRGNCAPDPVGSAQATRARGHRFESWACQIIFWSDFGTFLRELIN